MASSPSTVSPCATSPSASPTHRGVAQPRRDPELNRAGASGPRRSPAPTGPRGAAAGAASAKGRAPCTGRRGTPCRRAASRPSATVGQSSAEATPPAPAHEDKKKQVQTTPYARRTKAPRATHERGLRASEHAEETLRSREVGDQQAGSERHEDDPGQTEHCFQPCRDRQPLRQRGRAPGGPGCQSIPTWSRSRPAPASPMAASAPRRRTRSPAPRGPARRGRARAAGAARRVLALTVANRYVPTLRAWPGTITASSAPT